MTNCDRRSYTQKLWRSARTSLLWRQLDRESKEPRILLIHPGMAEPLSRSGFNPERFSVLPNPVLPFTRAGIAAQKNTKFAFVGRLDPEKGGLFLARACRKAGVQLMVMGEGPEYAAIQATGAEMHGWCTREQIGTILKDARMLVMPSQYPEPFGLVMVEALGSGLPVIASQTALLANNIVDAGAGDAFDATDEAALVACLKLNARDDARVAEFSLKAQALALEIGLPPDDWFANLESIYAAVLAGS